MQIKSEVWGLRMVHGYDILCQAEGSIHEGNTYWLKNAVCAKAQLTANSMSVSISPLTPFGPFNPNDERSVFMDIELDASHVLFKYAPNDAVIKQFRSMLSGIVLPR